MRRARGHLAAKEPKRKNSRSQGQGQGQGQGRRPGRGRTDEPRPTVAFLGLGRMGMPMARRIAADFAITLWHRVRERADSLAAASKAGTSVARTPRATVKGAALVVTCMPDGRALEQLFAGEEGL